MIQHMTARPRPSDVECLVTMVINGRDAFVRNTPCVVRMETYPSLISSSAKLPEPVFEKEIDRPERGR